MLRVVTAPKRLQRLIIPCRSMHSPQHTSNKFVNTITLLHKRHQRRNPTLIIRPGQEMRKYQLLERIDLVLQVHEIVNRLITLVRIIDRLQTDIFLVFEQTVELRVFPVEVQLRLEEEHIFPDEGTVSADSLAGNTAH